MKGRKNQKVLRCCCSNFGYLANHSSPTSHPPNFIPYSNNQPTKPHKHCHQSHLAMNKLFNTQIRMSLSNYCMKPQKPVHLSCRDSRKLRCVGLLATELSADTAWDRFAVSTFVIVDDVLIGCLRFWLP